MIYITILPQFIQRFSTFHSLHIQLFQKTLSKEKQTSHKPRPQASMGSFKSVFIAAVKRELKKPRQRRRGQRLKNEFISYVRISRSALKSFTRFISVQAITKLNLGHIDKSETEKFKNISRRGSHSLENTELGHVTFLFCRGRQRNVP